MRTCLATKNRGKLGELRAIFAGSPLQLESFDRYADVAETGDSYLANALLKARTLAAQLREAGIAAASLADDSGLEVAALGGRPGVYSARYSGADATWPQRRAALLAELDGVPEGLRGAQFVATMALVLPDGREFTACGRVTGNVVREERGSGGFGYDPLFYYAPQRRTFAEMRGEEKNRISHRRAAADALLAQLGA